MKLYQRLLALLFAVLVLPVAAQGAESNSITVSYSREGQPIAGAAFQLYRMEAEYDDAQDAYASILQSGQNPVASVQTDAAGRALFSGLENGTYLLTGTPCRLGNKILYVETTLYTLPCDDGTGTPTGNITVEPKFSEEEDQPLTYRVLKLWEGDKTHPDAVQVQLYRNKTLNQTVTLDKSGSWQYSWEETDPTAVWAVVEKVPQGYDCTYARQGDTFTITNTLRAEDPTTPTETKPQETTKPTGPKLPQTGQLWWPVPFLALSGMVLFLMGWIRRKESRDEG